jgi:hypothetical protein
MEAQRRAFATFLSLHAQKARTTSEPIAHLQFHGTTTSVHEPLIAFTMQNVLDEFDTDSELVRWLLNQMSTYDPERQTIVGLVFDASTIISEVLHARGAR